MPLKTETTIQFFKEIARIPRESGNESAIADYLCRFAEERKLPFKRDAFHNVWMKKKNCEKDPIILQAHTDMVCEKEEKVKFDFSKESIEVIEEDGYLHANGTTLGADNGIGIAQILSVLDSDMPVHVEAVFTVSEETSMVGAINFDSSLLEGSMLLNLDGFEENTILMESAGFHDIILKMENRFQKSRMRNCYEINLSGLEGGHSGFDIDKKRGNSSMELAQLLMNLQDIELVDFVGGTKFNVIPSNARAEFFSEKKEEEIRELVNKWEKEKKNQFIKIRLSIQKISGKEQALTRKDTKNWLKAICAFPHGVQQKNERGEVTTSINLGVVNLREQEMKVGMRSSRKEEEKDCLDQLKAYCQESNFQFHILGAQPSFRTNENADIIKRLLDAHPLQAFHGNRPRIKSMHITVEVGFFQEKNPELQIAIISPNIKGAHTPKECVEIASIERTNQWIENFLNQN